MVSALSDNTSVTVRAGSEKRNERAALRPVPRQSSRSVLLVFYIGILRWHGAVPRGTESFLVLLFLLLYMNAVLLRHGIRSCLILNCQDHGVLAFLQIIMRWILFARDLSITERPVPLNRRIERLIFELDHERNITHLRR